MVIELFDGSLTKNTFDGSLKKFDGLKVKESVSWQVNIRVIYGH